MARSAEFVLGLSPVAQYGAAAFEAAARTLTGYLADALGLPVRAVTLADYDAQIAAIGDGTIDAAVLGAYAFSLAQASAGAEALAMSVEAATGTLSTYQSVVIARADAQIRALADLRGRTVGFVDPGSTAGYLLPRLLLRGAGIDPDAAITAHFLHSHSAVPEAVLARTVDAGALHRLAFAPRLGGEWPGEAPLRVIATSPPVPRGPFAVRRGLPREIRQRLLQALLRIHEAAPGGTLLVLAPGMRFRPASGRDVTLKTVAALSGVSYGTVSRVVNGGARVAPETHARVADVVRELGYRPNATAIGLVADRPDLIGFVVPDAAAPDVAATLAGLQRACATLGLRAVLCPTSRDRDEEARWLDLLDVGRFGGLVLSAWSRDTPDVGRLAAAGRPLILVGVPPGSAPVATVAPDLDAAAALAVAHLRDHGHKRLGVLCTRDLIAPIARQIGADTPSADTIPIQPIDDAAGAGAVARAILDAPGRPTAVICGTEQLALVVLQAAHELSIPVPAELSIVALTESWLAAATAPPLTTAATSADALGAWAGALLLERLGGERAGGALPAPAPALIVRASTATAPR